MKRYEYIMDSFEKINNLFDTNSTDVDDVIFTILDFDGKTEKKVNFGYLQWLCFVCGETAKAVTDAVCKEQDIIISYPDDVLIDRDAEECVKSYLNDMMASKCIKIYIYKPAISMFYVLVREGSIDRVPDDETLSCMLNIFPKPL